MKELSIEQKAKSYDEAFERVKELLSRCRTNRDRKTMVYRVEDIELIFPELAMSEDERIRKEFCKDIWTFIPNEKAHKYIAWLEKQGKKNLDDEVEPKFHEGDWITNGDYTWKIVKVKPLDYILQSQDGNIVDDTISHIDEHFHSFTIQDAKKGDVLALSYAFQNYILIYKGLHEKNFDTMMSVFCSYYVEENTYEDGTDSFHAMNRGEIITPATKEQRDILIKAMADAGYTFDFEKKELKEIETEIEIPFGAKDSELQEATYYIPKGFYAEIDDDKVVIKKGEKPTAWSKKDEKMFEYALNMIEWYSGKNEDKSRFVSDWLKCIKQRIGG